MNTTILCIRCAQQRPTNTTHCPGCLAKRKAAARRRAAAWYAQNTARKLASAAQYYQEHQDTIIAQEKCRRMLGHTAPDLNRRALSA